MAKQPLNVYQNNTINRDREKIPVYIDKELLKKVDKAAAKDRRSRNSFIAKACEEKANKISDSQ